MEEIEINSCVETVLFNFILHMIFSLNSSSYSKVIKYESGKALWICMLLLLLLMMMMRGVTTCHWQAAQVINFTLRFSLLLKYSLWIICGVRSKFFGALLLWLCFFWFLLVAMLTVWMWVWVWHRLEEWLFESEFTASLQLYCRASVLHCDRLRVGERINFWFDPQVGEKMNQKIHISICLASPGFAYALFFIALIFTSVSLLVVLVIVDIVLWIDLLLVIYFWPGLSLHGIIISFLFLYIQIYIYLSQHHE